MSHYTTLKGLGRAVAYYPELGIKLGNPLAGILLCQLIYWNDKTDNALGIYKSSDEWTAETGMSYSQQRTARKLLRSLGLLVETEKRLEHKIFFKLDVEAFDKWFQDGLENNDEKPTENDEVRERQNIISRNEDLAFGDEQNVSSGTSNMQSVIHKITSLDYIHKNMRNACANAPDFELFWNAYPRKKDRKKAYERFKKIDFKKHPFEHIMKSLEQQKMSEDWKKEDGKFIPLPTTWIGGERWNDEFTVAEQDQTATRIDVNSIRTDLGDW